MELGDLYDVIFEGDKQIRGIVTAITMGGDEVQVTWDDDVVTMERVPDNDEVMK